jgi:hypothetical protein
MNASTYYVINIYYGMKTDRDKIKKLIKSGFKPFYVI